MLHRLGLGMIALLLAGAGCATAVNSSSTGGGAVGSGGGGGVEVDAGSDAHAGPCVFSADCPPTNDPCTSAVCVNGACETEPTNEGGGCDDGDYCTQVDTCESGVCVGGTQKYCPAPDTCHIGACDSVLKDCISISGNEGGQCDDGDPCTSVGHCSDGVCAKGNPVDCSFLDGLCSVGYCDPQSGCAVMALSEGAACDIGLGECLTGVCTGGICDPVPVQDGIVCDPGVFDPCTTGFCNAGACDPTPVPDGGQCDPGFFDPCITGVCGGGTCDPVPANDGTACDDGDLCTIGDSCQQGVCASGGPNPCVPQNGCYVGSCDAFNQICNVAPVANGTPCDDGDACHSGKTCTAGACTGGVVVNNGGACDDGKSCTAGETCNNGVCGGGAGPTIYFSEDFHDNSQGWTLGQEWGIGPALPSTGEVYGNPDPAIDHTPTGDNGVAGVAIGGNAVEDVHSYYYLTSPAFDTSAAAGQVIFGFYRWLNSDYDPYMHNSVDVWNGSSWVNLFTSGDAPGVQDPTWTYVSFNVTAHKNAAMKVRFGFDIGDLGVYTVSSWNVDDVLVASVVCP